MICIPYTLQEPAGAFVFKAATAVWILFFPTLFPLFAAFLKNIFYFNNAQNQNQERLIPVKKLSATNLIQAGKLLQALIHCSSFLGGIMRVSGPSKC